MERGTKWNPEEEEGEGKVVCSPRGKVLYSGTINTQSRRMQTGAKKIAARQFKHVERKSLWLVLWVEIELFCGGNLLCHDPCSYAEYVEPGAGK